MAERLAKEPKPSFVIVITVSASLDVADIYVIHLADDRLAAVLKRLREETAKGTSSTQLNRKYINFSLRDKERVGISGHEIRESLQNACGTNVDSYVERKRTALHNLGYDEKRYVAHVTFRATSQKELVELFLGVRKDHPVDRFETIENRFGIGLQDVAPQEALISVNPNPVDHGKLLIKGVDDQPPAVFDIEFYALPKFLLDNDEKLVHLKSHLFRLDLKITKEGTTPRFHFDTRHQSASCEEWWNYWRALQVLHSNSGFIEIRRDSKSTFARYQIRTAETVSEHDYRSNLAICLKLIDLFKQCGLGTPPLFDWNALGEDLDNIDLLRELVLGMAPTFRCNAELDHQSLLNQFHEGRTIVSNRFYMGEKIIAYYAIAEVKVKVEERITIEFHNMKFGAARILEPNQADFDDFIDGARAAEGMRLRFNIQSELSVD